MSDLGIFLIGSGPSLNKEDIQSINQEHTFCFNRSYLMFDSWNFTPTYYGCFDQMVAEDLAIEIKAEIFSRNTIRSFITMSAKPAYNNLEFLKVEFPKIIPNTPFQISKDSIANLDSAGATATQIIAALGYKKIILLGMDAKYDLATTTTHDKNHFDHNYTSGLRKRTYMDLSAMHAGWQKAALGCAEAGIEVINASRDSALTCFPRKSLIESIEWLNN